MSERVCNGVLRVGKGRGFVVACRDQYGHPESVIITAAHCLPKKLPPPHPMRYLEEATYRRLLGPLDGRRTVWAQCIFVDPVADIAVLGQPDDQALSDEADAYNALVGDLTPFAVADAPKQDRAADVGGYRRRARTSDQDPHAWRGTGACAVARWPLA
jgi:hypothetical protein